MVRRVDITDCHNYYNDDATLLDIISKDLIKINITSAKTIEDIVIDLGKIRENIYFELYDEQGILDDGIEDEITYHYIDDLGIDSCNGNQFFYSFRKEKEADEPFIEIDLETKAILHQIEINIIKLKQSKQFFLIAPKLEKAFKYLFESEQNNKIDVPASDIIIDDNFKIILPQYQNREINLSHLTKAIYILFLKHPEGILLNELYKYEDELFTIYKTISYQISLDKMKNSVQELLANDKAIFVHFSRIKSAFRENSTNYHSKWYYIQGEKGQKKFIRLPSSKIFFCKEI